MDNGILFQGYEWYLNDDGSYYKDLILKLDELKSIGITAIWLPPVTKATGTNDPGYGIYDLWDLGEFDQKGAIRTKYGTKKELIKLIKEIHNRDMSVYADVVLNHKAGADRVEEFMVVKVDENDRTQALGKPYKIKGWTGFDFKNRSNEYSDFKWNYNHFTGIDYDEATGETGIFRIIGEDKGWGIGVSSEKGNFDYLMFADIDHAHPDVIKELKDWSIWFINELNLDGFRFDALKHIDKSFLNDLVKHIQANSKEDFYLLGEYWQNEAMINSNFLKDLDYNLDLFDVVLHFNLHQASLAGADYDLRTIFDNSLVKTHPSLAVTFVDNHDSQTGQSLESFVDDWFKEIAYGIILLRQDGYPCIFYGDYYGTLGDNSFNGIKDQIDILAKLRINFAYGDQDEYMQSKNTIGWVRHGDEKHPHKCAVVVSNNAMDTVTMFVGIEQANKKYSDYTGNNQGEVYIDEKGYGNFMVSPSSISVWVEAGIKI